MTAIISHVLSRLDSMILEGSGHCHFNEGADAKEISRIEDENGFHLPPSFKHFLEKHNGGMIVSDSLQKVIDRDKDLDTAKWNANYILGIEEIAEAYYSMMKRNFGVAAQFGASYPFIPFCSTSTQEYLVFINSGGEEESAVLDAFHEESPESWGMVSENFTDFLLQYLDTKGNPDVIGDEAKGVASDIIGVTDSEEITDISPEATIAEMSTYLEEEPEDDWVLVLRGAAHKKKGNLGAALSDLNKAIGLKSDDAYYYFTRGSIYEMADKTRAALIDYDTAAKLEPDDNFYRVCRASSLRDLGKLHEALIDLDKAIEIDNDYVLALMVREKVYRLMGDDHKADLDARRIDELED